MALMVKICENGHFHLFCCSGSLLRAPLCDGDTETGRRQSHLEMSVQLMTLHGFLLKSGLIAACPCASLEQENGLTALGASGQRLNLSLQLNPWVQPLGSLQDPQRLISVLSTAPCLWSTEEMKQVRDI